MELELRGISKNYRLAGGVEVPALHDINLRVRAGECVALVGPSGCGKTTLLSILGLLSSSSTGEYILDGRNVDNLDRQQQARCRGDLFGFVFQSYNLLPREKAWRNAMLPLAFRASHRKDRRKRAVEALDAVGLRSRMNHIPSQLSGGEQQRIAIARALINRPALILADEPTGNLDSKTGTEILELIRQLTRARGATVIMATHNQSVAESADRIIAMQDGQIRKDESGA
jgi:putative ABC transport system ATP-binding protein